MRRKSRNVRGAAVRKVRDEEEVGLEGSGVQDDKEERCKCTRQSTGVWSRSVNEPGACEEAGQWARVTRVREGALWKGTVSGGGREME